MAGTRIASVSGLRGIVGDGLDPAAVVEFAAAYAAESGVRDIFVAHDGRPTAALFVQAVCAGVTATGRNVLLLGAAATPTIGYLIRQHSERGGRPCGGIQVSASHNPPEYNGLKFFQPGGMVLGPEQGRAVLARFEARDFGWAPWDALGEVHESDAGLQTRHLDEILEVYDAGAIRRREFKVALDACHGAGGKLAQDLFTRLGCGAVVLGGQPDGRYDHPPEPTEANLKTLTSIVPAIGADVGFAQDPDADRLAIVDETGRYIGEELTLALAARHILAKTPGPLVLNLSTSRTAEVVARRLGCQVYRTPVGEINVVEGMQANGAILGGEGNGGVIDPRVGFVRDSFVGMAVVLDLMAATGKPLSRLVDELPKFSMVKTKYPLGGVPVAEAFDRIAAAHPEARADRRDGLHLDWPDAWAHVRASNTEPIVRVIAEADDATRAAGLAESLGQWFRGA